MMPYGTNIGVADLFDSFSPGFTGGYSNLTLFRVFRSKKSEGLEYKYPPAGGEAGGLMTDEDQEPRRGFNNSAAKFTKSIILTSKLLQSRLSQFNQLFTILPVALRQVILPNLKIRQRNSKIVEFELIFQMLPTTVAIKGTITGVVTNIEGAFSLVHLQSGNNTLQRSCIGYIKKEVTKTNNPA
jgi:hypothetical protein